MRFCFNLKIGDFSIIMCTYCQAVATGTMVLERPDGKSERFFSTVSASEVVKSHPSHQLSSSPPPYLTAALSASSESNYSVLPIISALTCIYTHLFQSIITYSLSCNFTVSHGILFCHMNKIVPNPHGLAPKNSEPLLQWSHR